MNITLTKSPGQAFTLYYSTLYVIYMCWERYRKISDKYHSMCAYNMYFIHMLLSVGIYKEYVLSIENMKDNIL